MAADSDQQDDTSYWTKEKCPTRQDPVAGDDDSPLQLRRSSERLEGSPERSIATSYLHNVWEAYRHHVRRNYVALQLADDMLIRLLFWTPHHSSHKWREVLYGLISLHRMAMDMAHQEDSITNTYGTTVAPTEHPAVPATAFRIGLTVTHNLMPIILQVTPPHRQAAARLWIERIKFISRMILLVSYWKQMRDESGNVVGGLLQDGGMYRGPEMGVLTVDQTLSQTYRREYVGRRTGRRVATSSASKPYQKTGTWLRLILGDLLHAYRPMYWAQAECQEIDDRRQLWTAWVLSLIMDLTSLECFSGQVLQHNAHSQAEWNRRRMKLLLYLLRSPAWDQTTEPSVARLAALLRRVPLLGRLAETYIWEWLLYLKHPFVTEEE